MINNLIITLKVFCIVSYSYIINVLINRSQKNHIRYCVINISRLNLFFIKLLQWVFDESENNDNELKQLFKNFGDNVYFDENEKCIENLNRLQYYLKCQDNNLEIDNNPINSGTIALVFKGYYNNKEIIIKQLRPNIKERLNESIDLMLFIGYIISFIPSFSTLQIYDIMQNNKENLISQIDFKQEVINIKEFSQKNKNKNIVIPYVYEEITNIFNNVILMEFLNGSNVYNIPNDKAVKYIPAYNRLLIDSLLVNGIFHADLHPGNVIFMDESKLGLIDFGYVIRIEKELCKKIFTFYNLIFNKKLKKLAKFTIEEICENNKNHVIMETEEVYECLNKELIVLFSTETAFNGKRPLQLRDFTSINEKLQVINKKISKKFMNVALALGPCCSLVSIIKKTEFDNSFKYLFFEYIKENIPDTYKNYDELNVKNLKKINIDFI